MNAEYRLKYFGVNFKMNFSLLETTNPLPCGSQEIASEFSSLESISLNCCSRFVIENMKENEVSAMPVTR